MSDVTQAAPAATPQAPVVEQPAAEQTIPQDTSQDVSTDLSAEQEIDDAVAAGEITKQEAKDLKKTFKLKVDGQEFEDTIDLSDEKEVIKRLQMAKAFEKRGGEFTKARAEMEAFIKEIESDPEAYFAKRGVDLDKYAVERLEKKVAELQKTPEQKEKEAFQAELEQLRKEKAEAQKEKESIALERARDEQGKIISDEITKAIESTGSRLPDKDPYTLQRLSAYMLSQMSEGNVGVTVEQAVKALESDMRKDLPALFSRMSEEDIIEFMGQDNFDRARKKMLSNKKAGVAPGAQTMTAKQVVKDTGTKKTLSDEPRPKKKMRDFFGKV